MSMMTGAPARIGPSPRKWGIADSGEPAMIMSGHMKPFSPRSCDARAYRRSDVRGLSPEPQDPLPDVSLGELAHHFDDRGFGGALRRLDETSLFGRLAAPL